MQWDFKQDNNAKTTFDKMCSVFGEGPISDLTVRKWFVKFRSGNMTLNGELGVGHPSEFDDNFLKATMEQNPRQARDIQIRECLQVMSMGFSQSQRRK